MFGPLAFVAVRQKKNEAGRERPLVFAGAQKLIDDDLRAVDEVSELRFPQNESFGIVAAEAVFEAETCSFRERRIVNLAERLFAREMRKRQVVVFGFAVDQNSMALIECAALRVLAGQANGRAFKHERAVRKQFSEAVVDGALAVAHFGALLEQFRELGMKMKPFRDAHKAIRDFLELFARDSGFGLYESVV